MNFETAAPRQPTPRSLTSATGSAWGAVRHELLFLSFAGMEVALLTPFAMALMFWARHWPPALVALLILLVMLLPLNLIRLMSLLGISARRQRRLLLAALVVTVLVMWRALLYDTGSLLDLDWLSEFASSLAVGGNLRWTRDLSVFLLTTFVWWRGIRLAQREPEIGTTGLRLRLGGLIIAPVAIWLGTSFAGINTLGSVILFFLSALSAVGLVRAEQIEQERSGTAANLDVRWFAALAAAAALIVLAGSAAAAFVSGESLYEVVNWLNPLWRSLHFGGAVIGVMLLDILSPALDVFTRLVQALAEVLAVVMGSMSMALQQSGLIDQTALPPIPTPAAEGDRVLGPNAGRVAATAVMLGLVLLVSWGLTRAYRRAIFLARESERSRTDREVGERGESPLDRLLQRLNPFSQWRAAASVRRIYHRMCNAAGSAGCPRPDAATPYEYIPSLLSLWPEYAAEVRLISEAYVRIRYGEYPESREELAEIQSAWRTLERVDLRPLAGADSEAITLSKRDRR